MLNQYLLSINSWEWFLVFFIFFEFSFLKMSQTWVLLDHLFGACFSVKDFKQSKLSIKNTRWQTFERDEETARRMEGLRIRGKIKMGHWIFKKTNIFQDLSLDIIVFLYLNIMWILFWKFLSNKNNILFIQDLNH